MARRLWFKAKRYGWGWTPATWEGWAVTFADVAAVIGWVVYVISQRAPVTPSDYLLVTLLPIGAASIFMFVICWLKGERPRWHWGD